MTKEQRDRREKPIWAYIVITISFVFGIVVANASGQAPRLESPNHQAGKGHQTGNVHHVKNVRQRLVPGHDQRHPSHVRRRWILGVQADATHTGYLIRRVELHSAAKSIGLEAGDRIVAIDGLQIGLVGHKSVRLSDTLERQGMHDGRVILLVQNRRNNRLVSLQVQLRRPSQHLGH